MTDTTISQLPEAGSIDPLNTPVPVVANGVTSKTTATAVVEAVLNHQPVAVDQGGTGATYLGLGLVKANADDAFTSVDVGNGLTLENDTLSLNDQLGEYVAAGRNSGYAGQGSAGGVLVGGGTPQQPNGMWLTCDGEANWLYARVSKNYNPSEYIVYNTAGQGYATVTSSNTLTAVAGQYFDPVFGGRNITFANHKYSCAYASQTQLVINGSFADPVGTSDAWSYCYTSGSGICDVSGGVVTFVSGDPFIDPGWQEFSLYVNGVQANVTGYQAQYQYSTNNIGDGAGQSFAWYLNINNQLSTYRCHGVDNGGLEENVNVYSIAGDPMLGRYFAIRSGGTGYSGNGITVSGKRPLLLGSELYDGHAPGAEKFNDAIGIYPKGFYNVPSNSADYWPHLCLGGTHYVDPNSTAVYSRDLFRIYTNADYAGTGQPNRFVITPGGNASGSGMTQIGVAGNDPDISISLAPKGNGGLQVLQGNLLGYNQIACSSAGFLYGYPSDSRKKNVIGPIADALTKVNALSGVEYTWKDQELYGAGTKVGLIAQDVEPVIPEIVNNTQDGFKSVDYSNLTAVLVEAIKELTTRVVALENPGSSNQQA